ncbi:uncharacterized protein H6S33_007276 [Morchella sextelata]|uniref:uncharacterized protein n=1 Tax=Morchella sextelata TaxID=1174677 RepID=UPI001D04DB6C|nr:uncharacterized protein H6S33_007276 [Morchella sextelata]KAH0603617.1 hypothetical protein H6S33_007276 [Morchella sextelata]
MSTRAKPGREGKKGWGKGGGCYQRDTYMYVGIPIRAQWPATDVQPVTFIEINFSKDIYPYQRGDASFRVNSMHFGLGSFRPPQLISDRQNRGGIILPTYTYSTSIKFTKPYFSDLLHTVSSECDLDSSTLLIHDFGDPKSHICALQPGTYFNAETDSDVRINMHMNLLLELL